MALSSMDLERHKTVYMSLMKSQQNLHRLLFVRNSGHKNNVPLSVALDHYRNQIFKLHEYGLAPKYHLQCLRTITSDTSGLIACHYHYTFTDGDVAEEAIGADRASHIAHSGDLLASHLKHPIERPLRSEIVHTALWKHHACEPPAYSNHPEPVGKVQGNEHKVQVIKANKKWAIDDFETRMETRLRHPIENTKFPVHIESPKLDFESQQYRLAAVSAPLLITIFGGEYIPLDITKILTVVCFLYDYKTPGEFRDCHLWLDACLSVALGDTAAESFPTMPGWANDETMQKLRDAICNGDYWQPKYNPLWVELFVRAFKKVSGSLTADMYKDTGDEIEKLKSCIPSKAKDILFQYSGSPNLASELARLDWLRCFLTRHNSYFPELDRSDARIRRRIPMSMEIKEFKKIIQVFEDKESLEADKCKPDDAVHKEKSLPSRANTLMKKGIERVVETIKSGPSRLRTYQASNSQASNSQASNSQASNSQASSSQANILPNIAPPSYESAMGDSKSSQSSGLHSHGPSEKKPQ